MNEWSCTSMIVIDKKVKRLLSVLITKDRNKKNLRNKRKFQRHEIKNDFFLLSYN